jgi:hypothetical protein
LASFDSHSSNYFWLPMNLFSRKPCTYGVMVFTAN